MSSLVPRLRALSSPWPACLAYAEGISKAGRRGGGQPSRRIVSVGLEESGFENEVLRCLRRASLDMLLEKERKAGRVKPEELLYAQFYLRLDRSGSIDPLKKVALPNICGAKS
jgi:hypothetical protein